MVGVAAAFGVALGWSILSIWLGPKIGLVDAPSSNDLKIHSRPTALLGGVGVFAGIHVGMFIEGVFEPALFIATLAVLGLGLVDDAIALSPRVRLVVELAAAIFLVVQIETDSRSLVWVIGAVLLVLVAVNAVNLLDGLDGLVASVTVVSGVGLAWAGSSGLGGSTLGAMVAAAASGFLIVNWQPARVFLGDNGAYVIGMMLAYGVLVGGRGDTWATLLLVGGVLGVFVIDLIATVTRRARNSTPILSGDRSHIYDRLRDRGWSVRTIAMVAGAAQGILVVIFVGLAVA